MTSIADILVVEDDPCIGNLLRDIFTLAGGAVRLAPTADQASAQLQAARPALITLDLNLPGMRGDELLAQVRVRPETRDIPVILITSQLPVQREVVSMAEAVVAKPFDLEELLDTVNRVAPGAVSLAA
jgi:DNA-binding response OmpR family regulator